MALIIDVAAIAHNASTIRRLCDTKALAVRGVFKQAYALPPLLAAAQKGGIESFLASSRSAAGRVIRATARDCGLCGPDVVLSRPGRLGHIDQYLCTSVECCGAILAASRARRVWLGMMTSDGRDGVAPGKLVGALRQLCRIPRAAERLGVALNWGCLGAAPPAAELVECAALLASAGRALGFAPPVSLGGSTLLPLLSRADIPGTVELRVGEALLAGTLPGADGTVLGLRRPFRLDARVVDIQQQGGSTRLLIDRGHTSLEIDDVMACDLDARPLASAAEVSLLTLAPGVGAPAVGERIQLALGYRSMLRALLNRTLARRYVDNASLASACVAGCEP